MGKIKSITSKGFYYCSECCKMHYPRHKLYFLHLKFRRISPQ